MLGSLRNLSVVLAVAAGAAGCIIVDTDGDEIGGFGEGGSSGNSIGGFGEGGAPVDCLDDFGSPEECFTDCEGVSNCNGVDYFKAGVAENLVACLNTLNPSTCTFVDDVINVCTIDALSAACVDSESSFYCSDIAAACGVVDDGIWQEECGPYLDGLSTAGQETFANCQIDACNGGEGVDLGSCLFVLYP